MNENKFGSVEGANLRSNKLFLNICLDKVLIVFWKSNQQFL